MAECSRFRHGSVSNPEQQLVDELTSTPALGSRVVFFVDRPQPGQCGWSNLGGDPRERATRCGNGATSLQNLGGHLGTEDGAPVLVAFLQGYHYTYLTAAVLCLVGAALSAIRVSGR